MQKQELELKIRKLKQEGKSYRQVAILCGVLISHVYQVLRSAKPKTQNQTCESCGKSAERIHRHHVNYETDEIRSLCSLCHAKQHGPAQDRAAKKNGRPLSAREKECGVLILREFYNWQIANALGISVKTVEKHRQNMYYKLGVRSTLGLVKALKAKKINLLPA